MDMIAVPLIGMLAISSIDTISSNNEKQELRKYVIGFYCLLSLLLISFYIINVDFFLDFFPMTLGDVAIFIL
jgi:hypothetical protein